MNVASPEKRKYRGRRTATLMSAAGLLAVGLTGCSSSAQPTTCVSPRAVSKTYPGDDQADPLNRATWLNGVEIDTSLPTGAKGLIVGYRGPNSDWKPNQESKPVSPDVASIVGVRLGHDAVIFSVQVEGVAGSSVCSTMPAAEFGQPQPFAAILQKGAILPEWPQ